MQGGEQIPLASHLSPNTCMNRAHDFADYFINISSDGSFWSLYHIDQSIWDSHGFIASVATSLAHLYQNVRHIFAWDLTPGTPLPAVGSGAPVRSIEKTTGSLHMTY